MSEPVGTPGDNPAATPGDSAPQQADKLTDVLDQNTQILSYVAAIGMQVNWICQVVNQLTQAMPPFMRGAVNVPTHPQQSPGQPQPTPYPGHH